MTWLLFAFSGPVLWAISTHLDKYLVERYFKQSDVAMLLFFTACIGVLTLPFIASFEPTVFQPDTGSIALIVVSGILYMGAMLLYLHALQSEEASVVSPFFQTVPLFGYALAYFFLGETAVGDANGGWRIDHRRHADRVGALRSHNVRRFKLRLVLLMLAADWRRRYPD